MVCKFPRVRDKNIAMSYASVHQNLRVLFCFVVSVSLIFSLTCPVAAATYSTEESEAASYLQGLGVYQGNGSGDLLLEKGLTRAELATLLTRLHGGATVNAAIYDWACYFPDVPAWAKPYVGYCVANRLMNGYDASHFGPDDPVSPAMACTVVFRCCGYPDGGGSVWNYGTACSYAAGLGFICESNTRAAVITRGEMAVLIYRALKHTEETETAKMEVITIPQEETPVNPGGTFTITQEAWSREDYSKQANPVVFTGIYTKELYNVFRQTLTDIGTGKSTGAGCAYTMVSKSNYSAVKSLMGRLDGVYWLETYVPGELGNYYDFLDYFAMSAHMPDGYQAVLEYIRPVVTRAAEFSTDAERVAYLNDYLCTLMTYERDGAAAMTQIFSPHNSAVPGTCSTYARAFNLLCQAAGVPSFTIRTSTHSWNVVYADGAWGHVDVSANDQSGFHAILLAKSLPNRTDLAPAATLFLKEVLVPGSTG